MRARSLVLVAALALIVLAPVAAAGWGSPFGGGMFPKAESPTQDQWQKLFMSVFWVALVIFVIVEGLLLYAIIRFRRRKDGPQEGPHIHGNTKMEVAWTIAPTLVMAWLLVISMQALSRVDTSPPGDEINITVVGQQFLWEFFYPADATGKQASTTEKLYVEAGRNVKLNLVSKDVIHAFNVPQLGVMKDAIPGHTTTAWFRAETPGNYSAHCRELCGLGHGRMTAEVIVFPAGSQPLPYGPPPAAPAPGNGTGPGPTNSTAPPSPTNASAAQPDRTQDVDLGASGLSIDPKRFEAQPGQKVLLHVVNKGGMKHNLYIGHYEAGKTDDGAQWKTKDLDAGQTDDILVELPAGADLFEWWCNISGHRQGGMTGELSTGGTGTVGGKKPILPGPGPVLVVAVVLLAALWVARRRPD